MQPIPSSEHLIETKICKQCSHSFSITDADIEMLQKLSPILGGIYFTLPCPILCPDCRKMQRLAWRNEKNIFNRKCDATGKDIIAVFPPGSPFRIYDEKVWNSDIWDAKDYGQDFDFSRPFFDQFYELSLQVPIASKSSVSCENSDYCNACTALKNCYLTFSANASEGVMYSVDIVRVNSSMDCFSIIDSENCYECTVAEGCYNIAYSYHTKNCSDSHFLLSCDGCSHCYGCYNLTNAQFHIFNVAFPKEIYMKKRDALLRLSFSEQKSQFESFYSKKYLKIPLPNIGSENVTESENIVDSQNISYCRHVRGAQNIRYCQKMQVPTVNLAMDYTGFGNHAEKIYYSQQIGNHATHILFSIGCFNEVSNIMYSIHCRDGTHDCFGCAGLKNASAYCILNKQYSKEEYEALVPRIIEHMIHTGEWGEFFPARLSPFGYNHTPCQIVLPLTANDARVQGFNWSDYEAPFPKVEKVIPAVKLPDTIESIPDDILNWAIECEVTGRPFRIIKQELEFYRKHALPIPRRHPDQRYLDRLQWHINY